MSFRVAPEALAGYAAQVARAKEDAEQCRRYFATEIPATTWYDNGGVFGPIYYEHGSVRETVGSLFTHMVSLLEAASAELAKAGSGPFPGGTRLTG